MLNNETNEYNKGNKMYLKSRLIDMYNIEPHELIKLNFTRNEKIKNCSVYTVNWCIKAGETCPTKGTFVGQKLQLDIDEILINGCFNHCYANKNCYAFGSSQKAHRLNYEKTRHIAFVDSAIATLSRKRKLEAVRIHDGGDFYNERYLHKWIFIAHHMPDIRFYFYTKRVSLIKRYIKEGKIPDNVTHIFSYGGTEDHLIDPKVDRHSVVFDCAEKMRRNGYVDASIDDTVAWRSKNHRIGLLMH